MAALAAWNGATDPFQVTYLGRSVHDFLSKAAGDAGAQPDGVPDLQFHLEGLHAGKQIQDIRVHYPPYDYNWSTASTNWWATAMVFDTEKFVRGPRREDGQTTLHGPIVATPSMELFITEYPGEFQGDQFEVLVLYTDGSVQPVGEGLALFVGSDLAGNLVGVATYGGRGGGWTGRPGVVVTATAAGPGGPQELTATTDADGLFTFPLADLLRGLTRGSLTLAARCGEEETRLKVEVSDLPLSLTPRPWTVCSGSRLLRQPQVDLTGWWRFKPDPPAGFQAPDFDDFTWPTIRVPGHWVQQGFRSEQGLGGYRRRVRVPAGWAGQRIKLSFDGVYSGAEVWVNGERAGSHEGGATPFEFDVTDFIRCGQQNLLAVRVTEQTEAARLDKMSQYAHFPLTGIYRGARLFPVPPVHLARLHAETPWSEQGTRLRLLFTLVNEGETLAEKVEVQFTLTDPEGRKVPLTPHRVEETLEAWERRDRILEIPVANPIPWDAEHPHLYTLTAEVMQESTPPKFSRAGVRIGFRQVEVRGTHLCVNGRRVTLRGTCRHDAWPATGRTVTPELLRQDFELMRQANLNAVRTSHYPPAPELLGLADEMGFYVEEEAPFCWVRQEASQLRSFPAILQRTAEMVERDRSHPSVIFWSQANESAWGRSFDLCVRWMRRLDPTRPWAADGTTSLDLTTYHNPTLLQGVLDAAQADRPVLAGEALCIFQGIGPNGKELEVDPGLRDYYVVPLLPVREAIAHSPTHLGTMIWCWADDVFQVPGPGPQNQIDEYGQRARPEDVAVDCYRRPGKILVGYPPWGVVDGWRRQRPEWWLVKKLYTPIKIAEAPLPLPAPGQPLRVEVENRFDHTCLSEVQTRWRLGRQRGTLTPRISPRSRGVIEIPWPSDPREIEEAVAAGLHLEFHDRRGWLIDAYHLKFPSLQESPLEGSGVQSAEPATHPRHHASRITLHTSPGLAPTVWEEPATLGVRAGEFQILIDRSTSQIHSATANGSPVLREGPKLHLLPSADAFAPEPDPSTWRLGRLQTRREGSEAGNRVVVAVEGSYAGFEGRYELSIDGTGGLAVTYHFVRTGPEMAVRERGLRFALPRACDTLHWQRRAEFSVYPDDHIGRPVGQARAFPTLPQASPPGKGLLRSPPWPWSQDTTPAGSNDFRSTKRNLLWGSLTDGRGRGVRIESDGRQHLRAAVEADRIAVYVNDEYGGTNCRGFFEWEGNYGTGRTLAPGAVIEGTVSLHLQGGLLHSP